MNASVRDDTEVLIVGAGPTGLVLASWLTRLGLRVRIEEGRRIAAVNLWIAVGALKQVHDAGHCVTCLPVSGMRNRIPGWILFGSVSLSRLASKIFM